MTKLTGAFLTLLMLAAPAGAGGMELLMIEQKGCMYCAKWDAEVGPGYPHSDEGHAAPLRRHQLGTPLPGEIRLASAPVFTPTFILLADNVERGRIQGYPGADFFWPMLAGLIAGAKTP